ncbi:MAG: division/cell wall cluster transcriptional repressor MraZ [Candidatus Omnitrophica bacterium]|nr:division/cell wall cluster transcriptional repressor MraZ [Candidatus Omnitrophota bacterium]
MFYGEYEHTLDSKDRIIIPAKLREIFTKYKIKKFYITRGLDQCLFIFSEEEWKAQDSKFRNMPFTKQEARQFNRLYFSGASEVCCDKQGRILLPVYLKKYAGIQEDVMVVGVSNRIEIWALEIWKSYFKNSLLSFEQIAEKLIE